MVEFFRAELLLELVVYEVHSSTAQIYTSSLCEPPQFVMELSPRFPELLSEPGPSVVSGAFSDYRTVPITEAPDSIIRDI